MSINLNDPLGIQALLDEIRSSSAWQKISAESAPSTQPEPTTASEESSAKVPSDNAASTLSVASLLSQLKHTPETQAVPRLEHNTNIANELSQEVGSSSNSTLLSVQAKQQPPKDLRQVDFDNSVPLLLQLSREPAFVEEMKKIKRDQDALERRLWEERRSIHKKYEDKLKAANTKASIIGGNISKHEAQMLVDAHKKELCKFDKEHVLPAWDSMVAQQQLKLQQLNVPTMHVTSDPSARELQLRVLQMLTSIIGPSIK